VLEATFLGMSRRRRRMEDENIAQELFLDSSLVLGR
jgi:hypothetical protein